MQYFGIFPTTKFDFYWTFLTSLTINLVHPLGTRCNGENIYQYMLEGMVVSISNFILYLKIELLHKLHQNTFPNVSWLGNILKAILEFQFV